MVSQAEQTDEHSGAVKTLPLSWSTFNTPEAPCFGCGHKSLCLVSLVQGLDVISTVSKARAVLPEAQRRMLSPPARGKAWEILTGESSGSSLATYSIWPWKNSFPPLPLTFPFGQWGNDICWCPLTFPDVVLWHLWGSAFRSWPWSVGTTGEIL